MRYSQQRLGSKSFCLPLSKQGWYTQKQIEFCIGCELAFSRTSSLFSPQLIKLLHSVPKGRLFLPSLVTGTSRRIQILRFSTFGPSHVEWWKAVRKPLIIASVGYYVFLRQFDTEHQLSLFYFLDLCSEKSSTSIVSNSLLSNSECSFCSNTVHREEIYTLASGRYQKIIFTWIAAFLPYGWMEIHLKEKH